MADKDIIEKLLNGDSLRTFMIPDESIPSNYPEHMESYDLPHIIINEDYFWCKSETTHLVHHMGKPDVGIVAFCYTNIGPLFCSYNPHTLGARFMSKKRYKNHDWFLKNNFRLVWDSSKENLKENIKKAIETCSKFKIALLDSEDIWNIHPVDLPMYYSKDGIFELRTVMDEYPIFFRYPAQAREILNKYPEFFNNKPEAGEPGFIRFECKKFPSFYCIRSDGSYYNLFDIPRKTVQRYSRLKVFAEV